MTIDAVQGIFMLVQYTLVIILMEIRGTDGCKTTSGTTLQPGVTVNPPQEQQQQQQRPPAKFLFTQAEEREIHRSQRR